MLQLLALLVVTAVLLSSCVSSDQDTAQPITTPTSSSTTATTPPATADVTTPDTATPTTAATTEAPAGSPETTNTASPTATAAITPTSATPSVTALAATPTPPPTPPVELGLSLADLLGQITIAVEAAYEYNRSDWKHWTDADRDGQDTRQEVLDAESSEATVVGNGRIRQGLWRSLYDAQQITVAGDLDVDHVVALQEAHQSGGWAWDARTRELYANDLTNPDHLIAVSKSTNRSKGARDPAEWLPPDTASWCQYLFMWTIVKIRWELTMDQAEHNRILQEANSSCSEIRIDPAQVTG